MQDASSFFDEVTFKYVGRGPLALPGSGNDESLRYHIIRQIGEGGFGAVYEARDTFHKGHRVAIKFINMAGLSAAQVIEATDSFNREVKLLSGLRHAHLPRVYDHFTDPEHWYLVMDYIDGETLENYLEHSRHQLRYLGQSFGGYLPLTEVFAIILQLCSVLEYLHAQQPPIIFRDLKPSNIMRTARGNLYVIDFGIARHFKPGQAKDTIPFGSPGYAAPEQYGKAQTDPRADIYSLGALLHHLLTGNDPSENAFQFSSLSPLPSGLYGLDRLLADMLALNPCQRPPTIRIVSQAISGYARNISSPPRGPQAPAPAPVPSLFSSGQQSGPFGAPLLPIPYHNPFTPPVPPWPSPSISSRPSQQQPYYVPQIQAQRPVQPMPGSRMAAQQMSQQQMIIMSQYGQVAPRSQVPRRVALGLGLCTIGALMGGSVFYQLVARHFSPEPDNSMPAAPVYVGTVHTYSFYSQGVISLAWSPDGQRLASVEQGAHTYRVYNADSDWVVQQPSPLQSNINVLSWSPDGSYIACGLADGSVVILSGDRGQVVTSLQLPTRNVKALAWSPDSQRIAAVGLDGVVQVWNALDGSRYFTVSTTQQRGDATPLAWSPDGQYIAIRGDIVQILRAKDGQQISRLPADVFIYSFDWSPDSHYLVTISSDNKMLCWNILNNNTIMWQRDLEDVGSYSTIKWSPSGRYIATTLGNHKVVDIWDAQGNYITTYSDHSDMVYIVAWQPNNLNDDNRDLLASGSKDQTMRIWEFSPHGISDSDGSR